MNLSKMKVGVLDLGLWVEDAVRIARDVAEVVYCVPNLDAFKCPFKDKIGFGLEGLKVVKMDEWFRHIDDMDFLYIPDNLCAGIVEYLKDHDYPVAGMGNAEKLETDRMFGREVQLKEGMPIQATLPVKGITNLIKLMKDGGKEFNRPDFPDKFWVKLDNDYRGIAESFKHENWDESEDEVYEIASKLGPFKEDVMFMCEEMLEGEEPGIDGVTRGGNLVFPSMGGYEEKGVGIVMRSYQKPEDLPPAYNLIYEGLQPSFKKWNTRFFFSVEMILVDGVPFPIDNTMRKAGPGTTAIQSEWIENFTEFCYGLATGEDIAPVITKKYAAACAFHSERANKSWVNIRFPKEIRQWIKLRMACRHNGKYFGIPGFDSLGTVVGLGNTIDEVMGLVTERMEQVHCKGIDKGLDKIQDILKNIEKGRKAGINF